jgi:hypothetical protein
VDDTRRDNRHGWHPTDPDPVVADYPFEPLEHTWTLEGFEVRQALRAFAASLDHEPGAADAS